MWATYMTALLAVVLPTAVITNRPSHATGTAAGSAPRHATKPIHDRARFNYILIIIYASCAPREQAKEERKHAHTSIYFSRARQRGLLLCILYVFVLSSIRTETPTLRFVFLFGLSTSRSMDQFSIINTSYQKLPIGSGDFSTFYVLPCVHSKIHRNRNKVSLGHAGRASPLAARYLVRVIYSSSKNKRRRENPAREKKMQGMGHHYNPYS